ncbi:MAG: S8 family serine peptidase, partial [Bergeyella zoohelcum]|nr:S8 family serine peptidase [Bergeyella zoohelcum]
MGKTTTNPFAGYRVAMPVAVSFMLMPSLVFAQTEEQVVSIRKVSDFKTLNFLKQDFKKNTLSISDLKTLAKKKNIPFSGTIENKYYELRGFETKTGKPLYYVTYNKGAGQGTLTDRLHSDAGIFNLEGEDMVVYEWDGGKVLLTHQEFGGRVTQGDDATGVNSHATHVAGTMVASGVDGNAKGMAPKAKLVAHDWNNDMTEMIAAAEKGALISNHSYGFAGAFEWGDWSGATGWHWLGDDEETEYRFYGKYTTEDRKWDVFTLGAPHYLPVKAAGNPRGDGPEAGGLHYVRVKDANGDYVWTTSTKVRQKNGGALGYDTILHGALAKNILTVGAAQKISGGYTQPTDVQMASFSGYGPVDDGRIKPDITGVGVSIYSTGTANTTYDTMSGTSMASPNVTGSLLLLQELYKNKNNGAFMRAATLKALAIATANEAGANDGPDYASGWGLLNAYKAATAISLRDKTSLIEEKTLQNGNTDTIQVTAANNEPLVVTIAWADPISKTLPSESTLNERTKTLVNDLDLRIVDTNGTEYLPWKLDPANPNNAATKADNTVDNVEQVVIKNPVAGQTYTIKVSHKDTLKKNTVVDGTIDL